MIPMFGGGFMPPGPMASFNSSVSCPAMPGMGVATGVGPMPFWPQFSEAQQEENLKNSLQFQKNQITFIKKQVNDYLKSLDDSEALIEKQMKELAQAQAQRKSNDKKSG